MRTWILVGLMMGGGAGAAAAQACIGLPAQPGQFAVAGVADLASNYTGYGATLNAFLPGDIVAGASYTVDEFDGMDESGQTIGGALGLELPVPNSSLCPLLGASYSTLSWDQAEASTWRIPLTFNVGQQFVVGDDLYVIPFARAGLVHVRTTVDPVTGDPIEVADNEVLVGGGVTVGFGPAFVNGRITVSTEEGTRPTFRLGAGLVFP
jgi:hypothetical protein